MFIDICFIPQNIVVINNSSALEKHLYDAAEYFVNVNWVKVMDSIAQVFYIFPNWFICSTKYWRKNFEISK